MNPFMKLPFLQEINIAPLDKILEDPLIENGIKAKELCKYSESFHMTPEYWYKLFR